MNPRRLGRTGLSISPIGFGGFKIGRNQKAKYPAAYELPTEDAVEELLHGLLHLGITYFDTAPAYGLSEERIGRLLHKRRGEFVLATKVGENFSDGSSEYDFTAEGVMASAVRSLDRLKTDVLDVLLLHSDGRDLWIQNETDAVAELCRCRDRGMAPRHWPFRQDRRGCAASSRLGRRVDGGIPPGGSLTRASHR